jgi:uncharacterized membrane protein YoaK (UPF0700 family)
MKERSHQSSWRIILATADQGGHHDEQRVLKVVLVLLGLFFTAAIYPIVMTVWHRDQPGYGDAMMMSLYFALGILLLKAVRNPQEHRSLIAFAAWSSFAHGAVMSAMAWRDPSARDLLPGVAILVAIGVPLLVLAPRKPSAERTTAVA